MASYRDADGLLGGIGGVFGLEGHGAEIGQVFASFELFRGLWLLDSSEHIRWGLGCWHSGCFRNGSLGWALTLWHFFDFGSSHGFHSKGLVGWCCTNQNATRALIKVMPLEIFSALQSSTLDIFVVLFGAHWRLRIVKVRRSQNARLLGDSGPV